MGARCSHYDCVLGARMSVSPGRQAAIRAVARVRRDGAWIQTALDAEAARARLDDRDRAFATACAYGTVAHLGTLDDLIDDAADRPSAIEPQVRDVLRVATHELLFMGTPARAAVSEAVASVRRVRPRAAGYANAVLRSIALRAEEFPFGDPDTDFHALARLTGHPMWMVDLFRADTGDEAARQMMRANAEHAPLYVAHNPFKGSFEELLACLQRDGAEPAQCGVPGSVRCNNASAAARSSALSEGRAIVCDLSGQAIVASVPISDGNVVVDIASGRGTKTLLLQAAAKRAEGQVQITAVDSHAFKVDVLARRMRDLGVPGVNAVVGDATDAALLMTQVSGADVAFVDAPCSGLGTLRRSPEKRWSLHPQTVGELATLGATLLDAASQVVRCGGFVVYSTCTVTCAENTGLVATFLERHADSYEVVSLREYVDAESQRWITDGGFFQSLPELDGPDGHFAALLRRTC